MSTTTSLTIVRLFGASALFLIAGCRTSDEQIQTYRLAKEPAPLLAPFDHPSLIMSQSVPSSGSMPALPGMAPAGKPTDITWKKPATWTEQPPSSMRVGSFLVTGPDGQQADVSIIPLSGSAGGDLANINRWRDQIDLPPLSADALSQHLHEVRMTAGVVRIVDFVSDKNLIDGKFKKRVLAATLKQGERTWFFKMMGDDRTVEQSKKAFNDFLASVRLTNDVGR
jgi:hypothetical protein